MKTKPGSKKPAAKKPARKSSVLKAIAKVVTGQDEKSESMIKDELPPAVIAGDVNLKKDGEDTPPPPPPPPEEPPKEERSVSVIAPTAEPKEPPKVEPEKILAAPAPKPKVALAAPAPKPQPKKPVLAVRKPVRKIKKNPVFQGKVLIMRPRRFKLV